MDEGLSRLFKKQDSVKSLGVKVIGKKVLCYDLVTSTNDIAHFLAREGESEGTVVFAKGQSQGRGRQGNKWSSPYGKGLYFSIVLRPQMNPQQASRITLTIALSVAEILREYNIENINIKWPNDILIGKNKVCGIITEMSLSLNKIAYCVCGVGINVNSTGGELPENSVSLKSACGKDFDIDYLSHGLLRKMDYNYNLLTEHNFLDIIQRVKSYSGLILGERVRVSWGNNEIEGYAQDFDEYGALVVRKDNGTVESILSGHLIRL